MANRRFIDFPIASTVGENDIVLIWQSGANKQTTKATLLSGVAKQLNDLTDVTITSLANGQILQYDSVTGQWINVDRTDIDLSELGDVSIISPANGQVLVYNSATAKWENSSGGYVPYVGAVTTVNLGLQGLEAGFIRLDTSITSPPTGQGTMYWDQDEETVAIILNGSTTKVGEDIFFQVKNQSGATIPKGTAVRFDGVIGASGRVKIVPFIANGSNPSIYFLGVTYEAIADGADGKALFNGKIRGVDTTAFAVGDILYASPTVAGGFTTTKPIAPNNIISVAAVLSSGANGILLVRPQIGSNINNDEGVKITTPTTGDLLQLQASGLWENKTKAQILNGTPLQFVKGDGSLDSTAYQPLLTNPITGTGTAGQVAFWNGTNTQTGDSGLFWDNVSKRLRINQTIDSGFNLDVNGTARVQGVLTTTADALVNGVSVGRGSGNIDSNTRVGVNALQNNTTGTSNTANGFNALQNNTTGSNNTAIGRFTLFSNTTGLNNTAIGLNALFNNTTGNVNTANGVQSLFSNTTGINNTANGYRALFSNTTGTSNTANGFTALQNNTTGGENTANGRSALFNNTTGDFNTANGVNALQNNTTGLNNTSNGYRSLFNNITGGNNTASGSNSGRFIADGTTANTITNNSVFLGASTKALADNQTNQIVIGHNAIGLGSNTTVLGNSSTSFGRWYGSLLLGTTTNAASSILTMDSTTQGFLSPRLTSTQRDLIATPATGLQLYNTTSNTPDFYNGTSWVSLQTHDAVTLGTANGLSLSGQVLSLGLASGSANGALSSTDWTTFNNKIGGTIATGQVAFGTAAGVIGGDSGLSWDNVNKRLGVGTATPAVNIEIRGASNSNYLRLSGDDANGARALDFTSFEGGGFKGAGHQINAKSQFGVLSFATNSTERMRITSSGRVLIGTPPPTESTFQLDVNGTGRFGGTTATSALFRNYSETSLSNLWNDATPGIEIINTIANSGFVGAGAGIKFYLSTGGNPQAGIFGVREANTASALTFWTQNANGSVLERLRIASTGAATFSSSVTATAFFTSSDKRKKDIISQDGDLATYRFKGDDQIHYGYIAQDMQDLYPNQVSTDNDGMLSLNYIEILVKKVHDLETKLKKHGLD